MRLLDRSFGLGLVGLALLLAGCSGTRLMMPTPNVHLDAERDYYPNLAPELKDTEVPLFYVTDRGPEQRKGLLYYINVSAEPFS